MMKCCIACLIFLFLLIASLHSFALDLGKRLSSSQKTSFINDFEYGVTNLNSLYPETYWFDDTRLGFSSRKASINFRFIKFNTETHFEINGNQMLHYDTENTFAEITYKRKILNDWSAGLSGVIRQTPYYHEYNPSLKLELEKDLYIKNSLAHLRIFWDESLKKKEAWGIGYIETKFYVPNEFFEDRDRHLGVEYNYISNRQKEVINAPPKLPLLFSPPRSFSFNGITDYTFFSKNDFDGKEGTFSVSQSRFTCNYKPIKQLELTTKGSWMEHRYTKDYTGFQANTNFEVGLTGYLVSTHGFNLLINTSYEYQKFTSEIEWKGGSRYFLVDKFIVPSVYLSYRYNQHFLLNAMLTRQYYIDEQSIVENGVHERTWDACLALSVGF